MVCFRNGCKEIIAVHFFYCAFSGMLGEGLALMLFFLGLYLIIITACYL